MYLYTLSNERKINCLNIGYSAACQLLTVTCTSQHTQSLNQTLTKDTLSGPTLNSATCFLLLSIRFCIHRRSPTEKNTGLSIMASHCITQCLHFLTSLQWCNETKKIKPLFFLQTEHLASRKINETQ